MSLESTYTELIFWISIVWKAGIETIKQHPSLITILIGVFGLLLAKKSYENNNAPFIVPTTIEETPPQSAGLSEYTFKIMNKGKGCAKNITADGYTLYIEGLGEKNPPRWKLNFETIGSLASNEEVKMDTTTKSPISFIYYFVNPKLKTPLYIIYENLDGKKYMTSLSVANGKFFNIKFVAYTIGLKTIRNIRAFLAHLRVRVGVKIRYYLKNNDEHRTHSQKQSGIPTQNM